MFERLTHHVFRDVYFPHCREYGCVMSHWNRRVTTARGGCRHHCKRRFVKAHGLNTFWLEAWTLFVFTYPSHFVKMSTANMGADGAWIHVLQWIFFSQRIQLLWIIWSFCGWLSVARLWPSVTVKKQPVFGTTRTVLENRNSPLLSWLGFLKQALWHFTMLTPTP